MSTARTGIARYRLYLYAPGTTATERHDLVVAKRWWTSIALAAIVAEVVVSSLSLGAIAAFLAATGGLAVSLYWLARTRTIRRTTRSLRVAVVMVGGPHEVLGDLQLFNDCCEQLVHLGSASNGEQRDLVQQELVWAGVYNRMA
jgi:hypothetical protein